MSDANALTASARSAPRDMRSAAKELVMTRQFSVTEFDYAALEPPTTPDDQVIVLLLDALRKLADAGEVDAACRVAGRACAVLRRSDPKGERRFNALLHRLARRLEPAERTEIRE